MYIFDCLQNTRLYDEVFSYNQRDLMIDFEHWLIEYIICIGTLGSC